ncbi:MAG: flippase-like domain-containing protein [Nitrospirae bacterium]|nr:flippase-like domain-containing protein [Nitrospirota bacterium]
MRKHIITLLKIGIAILFLWYLFKSGRLTKESFIRLLDPKNLPYLILSAFIFICSQMLSSVRLIFLLRITDVRMKFAQIFNLTMIGNFFNMIIPGMVGGDIVKGYILTKNESGGRGKSSGVIVMDRVLGLFALLLIGGASVIYLSQGKGFVSIPYQSEIRSILIFCAVVIGLFLVLLVFGKDKRIRQRLKEVSFKIFRGGFLYNMVEGFGAVAKKRRYLVYTLSISIAVQLLCLAGLLILANMTGEAVSGVIPLMAVSSVVMLVGVIPVTPGNIGWTELIATFGWSAIGSNNGAIVFFYWRIVTMLCVLPWGLFYLYPSSRKGLTG